MLVQCLGWEDPLEEEMAMQSSILAWRIPWTEKSLVVTKSWIYTHIKRENLFDTEVKTEEGSMSSVRH